MFYLAMKSYGTNQYQEKLRESLAIDPHNVKSLGRLSEHLLAKNHRKEARELATRCIALDPKNNICHRSLISSFTRYGEFEESFYYLKDCHEEVPDNIHCNAGLFTYYLNNNLTQDAKYHLTKMEKSAPDSLWTTITKGNYEHSQGNLHKALILFKKACDKKNLYACKMTKSIKL